MRALRTIPVLEDFARDMEAVCPNAWFLNYTNPMSMLTGYMLRYTGVKTLGLCHSVQTCSKTLMDAIGMSDRLEGRRELIAGINHMGWLLDIRDRDGNDLYPEIRRRAKEKTPPRSTMIWSASITLKTGLLLYGVQRTQRRIQPILYQGALSGADRPLQHPTGRVSPPLHPADCRVG